MDRASQSVPAGALVGAVVLALGVVLPHSAARASSNMHEFGLLTQGLGCGPTETPVGADVPGLLARVRADAAKARPAERHGAGKAPRPAAKAPQAEQETRAAVLRTFYTCQAASAPNPAEGTGWRLVGPLRQG